MAAAYRSCTNTGADACTPTAWPCATCLMYLSDYLATPTLGGGPTTAAPKATAAASRPSRSPRRAGKTGLTSDSDDSDTANDEPMTPSCRRAAKRATAQPADESDVSDVVLESDDEDFVPTPRRASDASPRSVKVIDDDDDDDDEDDEGEDDDEADKDEDSDDEDGPLEPVRLNGVCSTCCLATIAEQHIVTCDTCRDSTGHTLCVASSPSWTCPSCSRTKPVRKRGLILKLTKPLGHAMLILCDNCDGEFSMPHIGLDAVPRGAWFCRHCRPQITGAQPEPLTDESDESDAASNKKRHVGADSPKKKRRV
ncbi:hypothetical protein SDRG_09733 [Saprolegnia diclina VS20]|uniref:PHD-type domain-containing protein n=1 Tax=Saprolegnia diclina (strain VS20) TaxID=1156394 RepID=T0QDD8_SAPDV|nr:hypothetical protein SDRG_09733 [Saprolegnia diclina VS20]EQC32761.1 hypothetical protein SDRG_09733 [Saprolegnia diclina VS20]|eukprot:XP_008613905.1 hypothetical protein SDRG_09733 [Saprolegnia diclina VS20]